MRRFAVSLLVACGFLAPAEACDWHEQVAHEQDAGPIVVAQGYASGSAISGAAIADPALDRQLTTPRPFTPAPTVGSGSDDRGAGGNELSTGHAGATPARRSFGGSVTSSGGANASAGAAGGSISR